MMRLSEVALPSIVALIAFAVAPAAPATPFAPDARVHAQLPRIGIIDFYGRRNVGELALRTALGVKEGDSITVASDSLLARIRRVQGVRDAAVSAVCCDAGKSILYIGVQETNAPAVQRNLAPVGNVTLPFNIFRNDSAVSSAMAEGLRRGVSAEDDSRGYTLYTYPAARRAQELYLSYVPGNVSAVRAVLRNSRDDAQRALAAEILPFAGPRADIVQDLLYAMHDNSAGVRNNAVRALAVIAMYAQKHPEAGLVIPATGFVEMLNSLVWTDRNKAAFALAQLMEKPDPALITALATTAMEPLIEMARWKSLGHATAPLIILGKIAGMTNDQIYGLIPNGREAIITTAQTRARRIPK